MFGETHFIRSITVLKLAYPLYNHLATPLELYYNVGEQSIFTHPQEKPYPAAVDIDTEFRIELSLPADIPPGSSWKLMANWRNGATVFETLCTVPTAQPGEDIDDGPRPLSVKIVLKQLILDGKAKPLPWALTEVLYWKLEPLTPSPPRAISFSTWSTRDETSIPTRLYTSIPIELYVFPSNLPEFFHKGGIPLKLLRLPAYLPKWMRVSSWEQYKPYGPPQAPRHDVSRNVDLNWASFVVNAMFSESRLCYENWNGTYRYLSFGASSIRDLFSKNRGFDCWLDLWLYEISGYFTTQDISVNCYDLAALCQIIVALGVDTQQQDLRMKYMQPFGYIRPTFLIGRFEAQPNPDNPGSLCNNPFYGDPNRAPAMLCDHNLLNRSRFGNHMFLSLGQVMAIPNVLDACCGPQLGAVSLLDYPQAVVDTTTPLCALNGSSPGTIADITDGPGVGALVIARPFHWQDQTAPQADTVFGDVAAALNDKGNWREPLMMVPADARSVTAKMYCQKLVEVNSEGKITMDTITVEVSRYTNPYALIQDYNLRVVHFPAWTQSAVGGHEAPGTGLSVSGSLRMFADDKNLYLATIESISNKSPDTAALKLQLEKTLGNAFAKFDSKRQRIMSVSTQPADMPQAVGTKLTVSLQVSSTGDRYWKGYGVRLARSNVLFVRATSRAGVIDFEFLARTPGYDTAVITIYGGYFETDGKTVNFWIR
ncbi:hypothetical protein PV08_03258 [Exophiala spinifera]|uniref:Uncharacterized protein n=1 Tax=Exophiala spinifera TaxID=91928 RepID=A0A0D2C608_9EURO|nr:uncharacterized protein PV08_03258 [Exophiala spinifera]KIW18969.1 hypothetical protein PV08_03258 [Exophiala spinifera]